MIKEIELFVPGRLCLFGEHSDWAGGHRRQNADIGCGQTIVAPTNQGTYAIARNIYEPRLKFFSRTFQKDLDVPLEKEELFRVAQEGELFSYVAGVAHEIVMNYQNKNGGGIFIDNYGISLPIKKGLSSSASVCVLTAKAFNEIWDLNWTRRRIMEVAYLGETTTPSRCGRMDQACAYDKPILMTFDGDKLDVEELKIGEYFYLLVVDLKSQKDTRKILADLSKGFPFPTTDEERKKHEYFNKINPIVIDLARVRLEMGDAELLGQDMTLAQTEFDEYLSPSCSELTAPKLHQVLRFSKIQDYVWGGKGVGSGGDGTAQFVCKSKEDREKAKRVLEEELKLECFDLDLKKT
jgi:galactokinase